MRKSWIAAGVAAVGVPVAIAAHRYMPRPGPVGNRSVPDPAKPVDLQQYLGRWNEQFRYEASFEKGLEGVTADYSLNDDGSIRVYNRGHRGSVHGRETASTGKARIVDTATNAKLKVSFFGPFYGDYWILDHGDDYDWSIVGEPSGRYLWASTRQKKADAEMIAFLRKRVAELGYDTRLIRDTAQ